MAVKTYVVTVPAGIGGGFYLDGVQKPTLDLAIGATYRFDQSDSTNSFHPINFSATSDGTHGGGTKYTTNVTEVGTPGSSGAYTEITLSSSTPNPLYYYCQNHSGMGGQLDLTADSWGALSWNVNSWGNQDENFINLSGFSLSAELENVIASPSIGWGAQVWGNGEWGELDSPEVIPTGISLSANLGSPTITAEVNVGWSAKTWGYPAGGGWGNLFDVVQPVSGFGLTANQGDETVTGDINAGWGRLTWGENGWGIQGTLQLSGIQMSTNIGSVSIDNQINIGWGSDTWGYETWGISGLTVDLTGIGLTATIDDVTIKADASTGELTGEPMTIVVDDVLGSATVDVSVTGQPMTMTLQYQEQIVDVTGQELTANDGTADLDANTIVEISATSAVTWGNSAWGYGVYGNQQVDTLTMGMQEGDLDPAPDAEVTGIAMAAVLDDVITQGDANTGTITDIAWGDQTWGQSTWGNGKYFDATGYAQAATINLGTAVLDANTIAEVSGQEMTMQENSVDEVTGNANVLVSGNALTMATGSLRTLIWNQVNTGTAPVVPPGWQEVDTAA